MIRPVPRRSAQPPEPMRTTALVPLLLVLAAAACGGDPVSSPPADLERRWTGSTEIATGGSDYEFDLRFTQEGREVGGDGRIRVVVGGAVRDSADVSLEGRYRDPELVFTMAREGFAPLQFSGRIFRAETQAADSLVGTLTGSGFQSQRLKLTPAP